MTTKKTNNLGVNSDILNHVNLKIAPNFTLERPRETGINAERQTLSRSTSRVSKDFYILAVAGEIKQMKPNIWKLQVKK